MKIKRFIAPDMRQALKAVKDALGPDAVILSNKMIDDGVELMAAIDFDQQAVQETQDASRNKPTRKLDTSVAAASEPVEFDEFKAMRQEMRELKRFMSSGLNELGWQDLARKQPENKAVLHRLLSMGISAELAKNLAVRVKTDDDLEASWQQVLNLLEEKIPVSEEDVLTYGGIVALVGPTGVGKTTTIAKLATHFAMRHGSDKVALVTTDDFRIGAREQLQTYGKILNVPVSMVRNSEEMTNCLNALTRYRLVLIDTAGMAQENEHFRQQMDILNHSQRKISKFITLSAATEKTALEKAIKMYDGVASDGCILTKLDEAASLGGVLSSVVAHNLALAYLTDGQKVPEDLQLVRSHALIKLANNLIVEGDQPFDPTYMAYAYGRAGSYAQL